MVVEQDSDRCSRLRQMSGRDIVERAGRAAFDRALVTNVHRAMLVETMIAAALEPKWIWCAADYAAWDFERESDSMRLEVRQSAARQSWAGDDAPPSRSAFDIAPRTKYYAEGKWIARVARYAHIYLLAHHPIAGGEADHRNPHQWQFYVIPTSALPATRTISLAGVRSRVDPVDFLRLATRVEAVADAARVRPLAG